jgi:uncharacterized protein (DUF1778 family)
MSDGYSQAMKEVRRKLSQGVLIRFEPAQLDLIDKAAARAGLNRTKWLRSTVVQAAKVELGEGAKAKG